MDQQKLIQKINEFIEINYDVKLTRHLRKEEKRLTISFKDILNYDYELVEYLEKNPEEFLDAARMAVEERIEIIGEKSKGWVVRIKAIPKEWQIRIRDIREKHLGRFIKIEGFIKAKSSVRPNMVAVKFECPSCANVLNVLQISDDYKEPAKCACGRKGKFRVLERELMDACTIKIEEAPETARYGTQLSKETVMLRGDLCDVNIEERLFQGMRVAVSGYLKEILITSRTGKIKTRMEHYMEANYVEIIGTSAIDINLSNKDIQQIKDFTQKGRVLHKLKSIIFKGVYGIEKEKEGLILASVEGKTDNEKHPIIRGKIHILMIGDPGQGKTTLRQAMQPFLPKFRRASGKGTTGVGIIGATVKDEFTGGFTYEVGDLPLADQGILFLDELDKLSESDRDALHQPMEELIIDISKANIHTSLLARATVVAGANPQYGRFDPYADDFYSQINLPDTLINRFDLVYCMQQGRDEEAIKEESMKARRQLDRDKMEVSEEEVDFVRKYIHYTSHLDVVIPQLIKDYIVEEFEKLLRKGMKSEHKTTMITQRQVGTIRRLAEAYAKATRPHTERNNLVMVDKKDVDKAIELIYETYKKIAFDPEVGQLDLDKITVGVTTSQRDHIHQIMSIIKNSKSVGPVSVEDIVSESETIGLKPERVEELIQKMKTRGDIFEPRPGFVKVL